MSAFNRSKSHHQGYDSTCRSCSNERSRIHSGTDDAFLQKLITNSNISDKQKSRDLTYGTNLTVDWIRTQMTAGCHWSGLPMQLKTYCWDKMSIDRINDSLRHCQENCRLTILALNVQYKWTDGLMTVAMDQHLFPDTALTTVEGASYCATEIRERRKMIRTRANDVNGNVHCTKCDSFQLPELFISRTWRGCKLCREIITKYEHEGNMHNVLNRLTNASKSAAKKNDRKAGDLILAELKEIYIAQGGLCAVSGKKLELTGHWKASLERLDPRGAYNKNNVALICACFNVIDRSATSKDTSVGAQGLNRERWNQIMQSMINKKRNEWRKSILGVKV